MSMIRTLGSLAFLPVEFTYDFLRFCRWSKASPLSIKHQRYFYDIVLLAHTVEKGLSQPKPRHGFGQEKITSLLELLSSYHEDWDLFPVEKSYGALKGYKEWHMQNNFPMGKIEAGIDAFLQKCEERKLKPKGGTKVQKQHTFVAKEHTEGTITLGDRYSCRRFADKKISLEEIEKVMKGAQRAPSQCNRQSSKIHCYQNKADIVRLLELQRGAAGFADSVPNLFVITSDMTAWSGCNARNQAFVDGSLFAMQLSLACHSFGIGTCPLNLAVGNWREKQIRISGNIPHNERLIMMMAFGYPDQEAGDLIVAKSERVPVDSILNIHR